MIFEEFATIIDVTDKLYQLSIEDPSDAEIPDGTHTHQQDIGKRIIKLANLTKETKSA